MLKWTNQLRTPTKQNGGRDVAKINYSKMKADIIICFSQYSILLNYKPFSTSVPLPVLVGGFFARFPILLALDLKSLRSFL